MENYTQEQLDAMVANIIASGDAKKIAQLSKLNEKVESEVAEKKATEELTNLSFKGADGVTKAIGKFAKQMKRAVTLSITVTPVTDEDGNVTYEASAKFKAASKPRKKSEGGSGEPDDQDYAAAELLASGKSYKEVAEAIDMKEGTLKTRIRKLGGIDTYKTLTKPVDEKPSK